MNVWRKRGWLVVAVVALIVLGGAWLASTNMNGGTVRPDGIGSADAGIGSADAGVGSGGTGVGSDDSGNGSADAGDGDSARSNTTPGAASAAKPMRVVASSAIFADMAANVGGNWVEVTSLIPVGADPHSWEPSIRELRAVAAADVFIYNGLGLEPWVERTLHAAAEPGLRVVVLTEGLQPLGETSFVAPGKGTDAGGDPHMWLDVRRAIQYVHRIADAFIEAASGADTPGAAASGADTPCAGAAEDIRRHASAYIETLRELDEWFQAQIDAIPPDRRLLVTDHDAYVYMAERYGLQRVGFATANPDREPSAREMARLAERIQELGVPAVFAEPHVGTSFIDELAREGRVKVGTLYTDAFAGDVTTYVDMMRANAAALRQLLGEQPLGDEA